MLLFESLEARRLFAAQGLSTTYFETDHLTGDTVERVEERINFDWNGDEPVEGFGGRFSVRFSALLEVENDDTYIFRTRSQGGVRLWVDGELLIDEWTDPGEGFRRSASIDLDGGKVYDLRLDYKEEVGDARIRLLWDTDTSVSTTVPNKRLFAYDRKRMSRCASTR